MDLSTMSQSLSYTSMNFEFKNSPIEIPKNLRNFKGKEIHMLENKFLFCQIF